MLNFLKKYFTIDIYLYVCYIDSIEWRALLPAWRGKDVMSMARKTGKVKYFNDQNGYGFIEVEGENDVFVHYSAIDEDGHQTLDEGETVEFDLVESDRRTQAAKVKRLGGGTPAPVWPTSTTKAVTLHGVTASSFV